MGDIKTYLKYQRKNCIFFFRNSKQTKKNLWKAICIKAIAQKKEAELLMPKMYAYDIPYFYITWKILDPRNTSVFSVLNFAYRHTENRAKRVPFSRNSADSQTETREAFFPFLGP